APQRIGKYEIVSLLGKGAMASVYLALDPFQQREVAIKVLEQLSQNPGEARKQLHFFQNEAALAGKLRHPHIVSILDAGVDDPSSAEPVRYLVMEVVNGSSLVPYCQADGLLAPAQVIEITYKCCKALEFANSVGVVHRDIKPANILVQRETDIKVSDFGAAQLARSDVTQVAGVGSPAYMSPEQVKDEEIDWRSDMFSLGGVLYHLLTGQRPYTGNNTYELIDSILHSPPVPPSELRQGVPPGLGDGVARAMGKARDDRFASWDDFAAALTGIARGTAEPGELLDAEKYAASQRLAFFRRFSDVELWEVVRSSRWRLYQPGEDLMREGAPDEHVYIIASGRVKVTQRQKLLNLVSAGECVGEMAYARRDGRPRSATITAMEPSWTLRLRVQDIDALSESCKARFNETFLAIMADRLSMLGGRLTGR
ncbi:MAG: protein kinase domain-containing protein, partial [Betaproteobacteria bacterium]